MRKFARPQGEVAYETLIRYALDSCSDFVIMEECTSIGCRANYADAASCKICDKMRRKNK